MPDNIPRPLPDVLTELYAGDCATPELDRDYADADCERLGLTNAVVVPDLAAHDREVREALLERVRAWSDEQKHLGCDHRELEGTTTCVAPTDMFSNGNRIRGFWDGLDAILGPAPTAEVRNG